MYLGEYLVDDYLVLTAQAHRFSSGAAYAPSAITYRIYEDATAAEIVTDTAMTAFDAVTGFYLNRIQLTAAAGFRTGYAYTVLIQATVDSVAAIVARHFRVRTAPVNVTEWKGSTAPAMTGDAYARLPAAPAAVSDVPTANANADALLDRAAGVETGWTFRQAMRIILAALGGKADGAATATMHYRDMADSKNRITATVDADGNRTAVTRDAT